MNPTRSQIFLITTLLLLIFNIGNSQNCIYPSSNLYFQNANCSLEAEICLDIPFEFRNDYEVYIDGDLYTGAYKPCAFDTTSYFEASKLKAYLGSAINPDMVVDSVRINGMFYSFDFTTMESLVDTINRIDITSDWSLSPDSSSILHEHNGSTYSWIHHSDRNRPFSGSTSSFQKFATPFGLTIDIVNGIHELVLNETATSCRDTVSAEIYCLNNTVYRDTIEINEIDTICLTLDDLRGSLMSVENICPGQSGTHAMVDPVTGTACIELTGLDVGRDSACFVLVDSEGLRDTIYYTLQVIQPIDQNQFFAEDDSVSTNINDAVVINPTMNDGIPNVLDTIFMVTPPIFGTAVVNVDGTISYQPNVDYESNGVPDSLTYTICIMSDCRTATVYINVVPPAIDIKTGFSPNDDGINDTFVIENIDRFPNNQLCVFNRWGNQVLQVENYQNNWNGKWEESTDLPDGTYFYVFDVEVDATMEQFTGFLQLRR